MKGITVNKIRGWSAATIAITVLLSGCGGSTHTTVEIPGTGAPPSTVPPTATTTPQAGTSASGVTAKVECKLVPDPTNQGQIDTRFTVTATGVTGPWNASVFWEEDGTVEGDQSGVYSNGSKPGTSLLGNPINEDTNGEPIACIVGEVTATPYGSPASVVYDTYEGGDQPVNGTPGTPLDMSGFTDAQTGDGPTGN